MAEDTPPQDTSKADSVTKVHRVGIGKTGKWGNRRVSQGMKVDVMLYKAFRDRTRQLGSSVCGEIEQFMVGYLQGTERIVKGEVHLGTTINLEQTVYRNLSRDRRKVNPNTVQEHPDDKARRLKKEEDTFKKMREEGERADRIHDIEEAIIEALTPWNGKNMVIWDELDKYALEGREARDIQSRVLTRLQDRKHGVDGVH